LFPGQRFADRQDAGRELGKALAPKVARGGMVVAAEVAHTLGVALDACVVRKIGSPLQPELAIGAVAPGGIRVHNRVLIAEIGLTGDVLARMTASVAATRDELDRQLRDGRPPPELTGKTVILVDDGLATGASMRAAVEWAKQSSASVIVAVPTASPDVLAAFDTPGVEPISLLTPRNFGAVGNSYERFEEVSSEETKALLLNAGNAGPER
jgi:putative phosphoribosyl transferase